VKSIIERESRSSFRRDERSEGTLPVRSRRGWDMTEHVGFLAQLPVRAVLDGELVALDDEGKPDFPDAQRMAA
jgi:ATP-dependent DNA ligase